MNWARRAAPLVVGLVVGVGLGGAARNEETPEAPPAADPALVGRLRDRITDLERQLEAARDQGHAFEQALDEALQFLRDNGFQARWDGEELVFAEEEPTGGGAERATVFGDGTWIVGEDIRPGTYRAPGGARCYWERLRNFSGNGIITNGFGDRNPVVTIAASDAGFRTEDCGEWRRL